MSWKCSECGEVNYDENMLRCVCGSNKAESEDTSTVQNNSLDQQSDADAYEEALPIQEIRSYPIWDKALDFHISNFIKLLPICPLLFVPVLSDALHSLLIKHQRKFGMLRPFKAAKAALSLTPSLFAMKICFELEAFLWSLIPIYGIIKLARHRVYWAMASNVLVFEGLSGSVGRQRCNQLGEALSGRSGVRMLITVPALILTLVTIVWVATAEATGTVGLWCFITVIFWLSIPVSGVLNTYLYMALCRKIDKS